MRVHVQPGHVTFTLSTLLAGTVLSALLFPLLHSPEPPGYSVASSLTRRPAVTLQETAGEMAIRSFAAKHVRHYAPVKKKVKAVVAVSQPAVQAPPAVQQPVAAGDFSTSALEQIWEANGGSAATAPVAACIAMHESGGRPGAESPTDDFGLWQIHADPAALSPSVSAAMAVAMSHDGTSWAPWTTAGDCGA